MVQQITSDQKVSATRALESVPPLGWGRSRECTFAGALEAALAATEYPFKYSDLMGFSALALRVRWCRWEGRPTWCFSCAVGEFPEECAALESATGWRLRKEVHLAPNPRMERFVPDIVASIDAGRPVLAYEPRMNVDVIYGYEQGGRTLLVRDYFQGDTPLRLEPSRLGGMAMFLTEHGQGLPRRSAIIQGLKLAVRNWWRQQSDGGVSGLSYWYGASAYAHWIDDLNSAADLEEEQRRNLFDVSVWNFDALADARVAAVAFLKDAQEAFTGDSRDELMLACAACQQQVAVLDEAMRLKEAFLGTWAGKSFGDWTRRMRRREQEILRESAKFDAAAIAHIEASLDAQNIEVQRR